MYTAKRLRQMFRDFEDIRICKRQLIREELPPRLKWMPLGLAGRLFRWNLIVKARKPPNGRARRNGHRPAHASVKNDTKADDNESERSLSEVHSSVLERELTGAKLSFDEWLKRRRETKRQYVEATLACVDVLRESASQRRSRPPLPQPKSFLRISSIFSAAGRSCLWTRIDPHSTATSQSIGT